LCQPLLGSFTFKSVGMAKNFEACPHRIVHKNQSDTVVCRKIARGNVLLVARHVCKGKCTVVNDMNEALRAAPMLKIWPSVGAYCSPVKTIALLQEGDFIGSDPRNVPVSTEKGSKSLLVF